MPAATLSLQRTLRTRMTRTYKWLARYLNAFAQHHLGSSATRISFSVARNYDIHAHVDNLNAKISVGHFREGGLWIDSRELGEGETKAKEVEWKHVDGQRWLPGRVVSSYHNFVTYDPHTCSRFSRSTRSTPSRQKGTRRKLAANAQKVSVLMTSLVWAATSFLFEEALFSAHCTARSRRDLRDRWARGNLRGGGVEHGRDRAYELGGLMSTGRCLPLRLRHRPRELRLDLEGVPGGLEEFSLGLCAEQLAGGGCVLPCGGDPTPFALKFYEYHQTWAGEGCDRWLLITKRTTHRRELKGEGRPHRVLAVSAAAGDQREGRTRLDGRHHLCGGSRATHMERPPKAAPEPDAPLQQGPHSTSEVGRKRVAHHQGCEGHGL